LYAQGGDIPPNNKDWVGEFEESEGGVSVVLIETAERESRE
jgi:hypothetical protein